jgi:hypothetical protein
MGNGIYYMASSSSSSGKHFQSRNTATATANVPWKKLIPLRLPEIVLAAVIVLVMYIYINYLVVVGTTVPHQDDWNLLDKMFQALDSHQIGAFLFDRPNGHFMVPAALAFLASFYYLSLDLFPLRLLSFPICLVFFFLTAHVINAGVRSRFLRFYVYLGACFVIFNLCPWVHLTLGMGFTTLLSTLFGGIGLYYTAKTAQFSRIWKGNLAVGLGFLVASILSFGAGYAAAAAAISLLTLLGLKKIMVSRPIPKYEIFIYCLAYALLLLAITSHPFFRVNSRIVHTIFHTILVAGSIGPSAFDPNSVMTQNVAFACGVILLIASVSIAVDFLVRHTFRSPLLSIFSLALVLFGLFGCIAIAIARSQLPIGEFLSTRYTLYPSICLLGTLLYFACYRVFLLANMWCFAATLYLVATVKELQVAPYRPAVYKAIELSMTNIDTLSDEQLRASLYWQENSPGVRRVIARMRARHANIFRPQTRE